MSRRATEVRYALGTARLADPDRVRLALVAVLRIATRPLTMSEAVRAIQHVVRDGGLLTSGDLSRVARTAISHRLLTIDDRGWSAGPEIDDVCLDDFPHLLDAAAVALRRLP